MMRAYDCFQVIYLDRGDIRRVDERQGSVGGLEDLVVAHNRGPLQRQADVFAFPFIESRMHSMLEISGCRYLGLLLFLREHGGGVAAG